MQLDIVPSSPSLTDQQDHAIQHRPLCPVDQIAKNLMEGRLSTATYQRTHFAIQRQRQSEPIVKTAGVRGDL